MAQLAPVQPDLMSHEAGKGEVLMVAVRRKCKGRTAPASVFKPKLVAGPQDDQKAIKADAVVPRWRAKDPDTGKWIDYDDMLSAGLEQKFQKGRRWVKFEARGREFEVDLTPGAMLEYIVGDSSYLPREVQRAMPNRYTCEGAPLPFQLKQAAEPVLAALWKIGQEVDVRRSSGCWDRATIASIDEDSAVTVSFKDGDKTIPQKFCQSLLRARDSRAGSENKERRVDPMLGGRAVTFSEMSRGLSGQGLSQSQLQTYWAKLSIATDMPICSVSALSSSQARPMLFISDEDSSGSWRRYTPNMRSVLVIGPGAGVHQNARAYKRLQEAGWEVNFASAPGYDKSEAHPDGYLYPPGWEHGQPELNFNDGKNLATLADNVVAPLLQKLVAAGRGPAAVIAGSRGGQTTLPRLWAKFWRGPTLVINGGCVKVSEVPPSPVRLVLLTYGLDFFETKDSQLTSKLLRKTDASSPVLLYHDPCEGHMPRHFGDVVEPLLDIVVSDDSFEAAVTAAVARPCILSQPKAKRHGVVLKAL